MNDTSNHHTPSAEFSEFLARDIVRTIRHDARFAPASRTGRARKLGFMMLSATGTVVVLAIGLAFGTSTGYASARVENERQRDEMTTNTLGVTGQLATLRLDIERAQANLTQRITQGGPASVTVLQAAVAELRAMSASVERIELDLAQNRNSVAAPPVNPPRSMPVKRALAVTCSALELCDAAPPVQPTIPTVTLSPASAKTTEPLWNINGIRQVAGGKLLVNDQGSRQLKLFDSTLARSTIALDSTQGLAKSGGSKRPRPLSLIAFLGDSTLLVDPPSQSIRVLDEKGQVARTVSLENAGMNFAASTYADNKGRLLYSSINNWAVRVGDSLAILRIDLVSRKVDTVGQIKNSNLLFAFADSLAQRQPRVWLRLPSAVSLVPGRDDWAVLSNGSIAFIRGHDYHIDWLHADGTQLSTPKLPFDWQHLANENKLQLDNVALARERRARIGNVVEDTLQSKPARLYSANIGLYNFAIGASNQNSSAVIPDLDGNLWILPSIPSAPSANAELVYDVVNAKGQLFERVRVPADRAIAGFGKGGVVYLVSGDRTNGFYLERTTMVREAKR